MCLEVGLRVCHFGKTRLLHFLTRGSLSHLPCFFTLFLIFFFFSFGIRIHASHLADLRHYILFGEGNEGDTLFRRIIELTGLEISNEAMRKIPSNFNLFSFSMGVVSLLFWTFY